MTDVVTLVKQTIATDRFGNEIATESTRKLYCEVDSISQSEFYSAANTELNPEYRFSVFFGDYQGEEICVYKGTRYSIYRTYRAGDYMELYAERKIGI